MNWKFIEYWMAHYLKLKTLLNPEDMLKSSLTTKLWGVKSDDKINGWKFSMD